MNVPRFIPCLAALLISILPPAGAAAQLMTVDLSEGATAEELAGLLAGAGLEISDVTLTGADAAAGRFSGGEGILDFADGVVLSTGSIESVVGPNNVANLSTIHGLGGDEELTALTDVVTFDAVSLEFEFIPDSDRIFIQYIFASEEYNEFVGGNFNDVFAFFINGENCATVNGEAVSINSINAEVNAEFFRDNTRGGIDTQMDGLTVLLTCDAAVQENEPNTMKLVLADASDPIVDSVVFLQRGGITTAVADLALTKSAAPDPVLVGDLLTYSLTVTNNGPEVAKSVTVLDTLPDSVIFDSASEGCSADGVLISCALGDLDPQESASIAIVVTPLLAGKIENTAVVSGEGSDPEISNNTVTVTTEVLPRDVDLLLVMADSPDPATVGEELLLSLGVVNIDQGPGTLATEVVLTNALPSGVEFVSVSASQGECFFADSVVTCELGDVDTGGASAEIVVRPLAAGLLAISASVVSAETDLEPENNTATVVTEVLGFDPRPDVAADGSGEFLVVHQADDGEGLGVLGQVFTASGEPLSRRFTVNSPTAGAQRFPATAALGGGRYVVVYVDGRRPANALRGQLLDRNGPIGDAFRIGGVDEGCSVFEGDCQVSSPAVAADRNGRFVVLWDQDDGTGGRSVFGRRFNRDAVARGGVFLVDNDEPFDRNLAPDIASFADGSFVAVTHEVDEPMDEVRRIEFDRAGEFLSTGQVNLFDLGRQARPAVATFDPTSYLTIWESESGTSTGKGIFARVNPAEPGQPEFQINSSVAGDQLYPDAVADASGLLHAVWLDAERNRIVGQSLSPRRVFAGDERDISGAGEAIRGRPRIASLPERRSVVVWGDSAGEVAVKILEPSALLRCLESEGTLCLNDGRFQIEARWTSPRGRSGGARAVPLTADAGYFWFFDRSNVELVVKVLRACSTEEPCYWLYASGLTDVEVALTVTDTWTGRQKTYTDPQGRRFQPIRDTTTFRAAPKSRKRGLERGARTLRAPDEARSGVVADGAAAEACGSSALCLGEDDRFRLELEWETSGGTTGVGQGVALTRDAGYFWFFGRDNLEAVFKMLEGCDVNGHFWLFGAGLTDVGVRVTVTDQKTGASRSFRNPLGQAFEPLVELEAFACR